MTIDPGVPMPVSGPIQRLRRYPIPDMGVGDSLWFPAERDVEKARVSATRFARAQEPQWAFRSTRVDERDPRGRGWRLFRVR